MKTLIEKLWSTFDIFGADVESTNPTFIEDGLLKETQANRHFLIEGVRGQLERLMKMISRVQSKGVTGSLLDSTDGLPSPATMVLLERSFIPPGSLRAEGPRHDNDFTGISQIQVLPTHDEILCPLPPFVPASLPRSPHHLPAGSIERLVDTSFRLLREDFCLPLRRSAIRFLLEFGIDLTGSNLHRL